MNLLVLPLLAARFALSKASLAIDAVHCTGDLAMKKGWHSVFLVCAALFFHGGGPTTTGR
jgi:hypothetical protein